MLLHVANVLTAEEAARCRARLDTADWADGRITAGYQSAKAKHNLQLPDDHPAWIDLDAIEDEHRALLADIDTRFKDFSALDEKFHLLVHRASGNRFVVDFYDVIAFIFHYHYQWNKAFARARNERAILEHLDYIEALRARDPARVEAACRLHLNSARETLLQSVPG